MANQNSFTETTKQFIQATNVALESMVKINESMTTANDTVVVTGEAIDPVTGDTSTFTYSIPSYNNTLQKLDSVSNAVDSFINGSGQVLLEDGTYRTVTTTPIAVAPSSIENVSAPSKFYTKPNWFFEDMIFPLTYVKFDLKDKIDDQSDRVLIKRLIFDNFDDEETQWFTDNIIGQTYNYDEIVTVFSNNNKTFWEDEQVTNLPLFSTEYEGEFIIVDSKIINGNVWYYLDTLNFGYNTDSSTLNNIELKIADQLRYNNNTLFKIDSIEVTEKRVKLIPIAGIANPVIGDSFNIYSPPFNEKIVDIAIGYKECNSLFIKGINDNYNITGGDWGNSISFYTNDLSYEDTIQGYENYYFQNVIDFGKEIEGQAKDRVISAFNGVSPDAPEILAEQFSVKQINTQINAALDTESIKTTQTQIESTKTIINSLKTTISQQKAELVELTDPAARSDLQGKIDNNTSSLSKQTIEYQSLVRSLSTVAYENDAVINNPKYRVRGFFEIPAAKTVTTDAAELPQEIIQFDISYRYLRLDGTGNPLETYTYADPSTGQEITGTFTDWEITQSPIKVKVWDTDLEAFIWQDEIISDGQSVNVNQVDISITKGEKVQIRIRSISEAGWPRNPLKSSWSNIVTVDFPPNLLGSDQIINILSDAQVEETAIKLDETLSAAGVITHIDDSVPNPNAADGTFFKHQAKFLAYDYANDKDITTGIAASESTLDLQSYLDTLPDKQFITVTDPSGGATKTVLMSTLLQAMLTKPVYDNL